MLMPPRDLSYDVDEFSARLKELERRVSALEHPAERKPAGGEPYAASAGPAPSEIPTDQSKPSVFPVFGKAILGIAGAYLLRAAAETDVFSSSVAVTLALAYAASWLVWAAWPRAQGRLAAYSYALTTALILPPLLWEVTVRFRMIEPRVAAAVLPAFALLAMILAWRRNVSPVAWIGMLTAVVTCLILLPATRALVPFTLSLLGMAGLSEFAASRDRWLALRPFVAVGADFAALILITILGDDSAISPEYHPVAAGVLIALLIALFLIYASSLAIRSLVFRLKVTVFEAVQLPAAVLLLGWGVVRITHGSGMPALGVSCLVAGAACYFAAFGLAAADRHPRNFRFYSAWGVALVTAGSFLSLPSLPLVIWFCLIAVAAIWLSVRRRSAALDLHGVVYLCGAFVASGLLGYAGRALAGSYPAPPGALPILAAIGALLCSTLISRYYPGEHQGERLVRLLPAILAVYATSGFAVGVLVWMIAGGASPTLPQLAVIRTIVICIVALLLTFAGARWKRLELVWLAYAATLLGSLKLLFEDLRIGSTQSLAVSLLVYGTVLILIPRLVRAENRRA